MKKRLTISLISAAILSLVLLDTNHAQEDVIAVARFNQIQDLAASGWQTKEWKGKLDAGIVSDGTNKVLSLKSKGTSAGIYKDIELEIKDSPYLKWQWKVTKLPEGGDVRSSSTDDQAAQLYVIFPKFPAAVNSRIIGYIWDTTAPQGSMLTSTKFSKTKYVVLRSGPAELGKWLEERRNVYDDYKKLFNEEPPKMGRVSLMIDSDDTKGIAECFFGDISLSKN